MKKLLLITFCLLASGCKSISIRDASTYKNEVNFVEELAKQQAAAAQEMVAYHCGCTPEGEWKTERCEDAAELAVIALARIGYHADMMRYLGGMTEERPPKDPPPIPENNTLCPGR